MDAIEFPIELEPNTASWEEVVTTKQFKSAFNNYAQVVQGSSSVKCSFNYTNLTQEKLRLIRYISSLPRGTVFLVPTWGLQYGGNDTAATHNVVVSGAGQTGTQLNTSGWDNRRLILKRGDSIAIDGELKVVAEDTVSDGSGQATIKLTSPIRKAHASGVKVTYNLPILKMRLVVDSNITYEMTQGSDVSGILTSLSLGLEEVIY